MEILREIIDCKSSENVPKNIYDRVCLNIIAVQTVCVVQTVTTIARMKMLSNTEVEKKRCLFKKTACIRIIFTYSVYNIPYNFHCEIQLK